MFPPFTPTRSLLLDMDNPPPLEALQDQRMRRIRALVGVSIFGVSVLLLAYFLTASGVDFAEVGSALTRIAPVFVVAALAAALGETALRVVRFRLILKGFGHTIPLRSVVSVQLTGIFLGNLSPMRVAEPLKGVALKRLHGTPMGVGIVATLVERLLDLILLLGLLLVALFTVAQGAIPVDPLALTALTVVAATLYLVFVYSLATGRLASLIRRVAGRVRWLRRLADAVDEARLKVPPTAALSWTGLTIAILLLDVITFSVLFAGLGISIPFLLVLAVVAVGALGGVFSQVPGGIGTTEAIYVFLFSSLGVLPAVALTVALVARFVGFYLFTVVGWVSMTRTGLTTPRTSEN
jgi:uncharacterized protein (TIRG00374 family)